MFAPLGFVINIRDVNLHKASKGGNFIFHGFFGFEKFLFNSYFTDIVSTQYIEYINLK